MAKLDDLINLFAPEIRDAFISSIQDITDNAIISAMIKAIENGDPIGAFRALGFSKSAMRPIEQMIEKAFEKGGVLTGQTFPKFLNTPSGKAIFRFDVKNSRSEAWLRDHSSQLITNIENETRQNVQSVLTRGLVEGRNPRNVALDIIGKIDVNTGKRVGGIVGLTPNQENWVANTRRDLNKLDSRYFTRELRDKRFDRTVLKAIESGKPLKQEQIEKIVTAYKNNALRYRGEVIGRTEALQSLNRAEWEAHMQAVDQGALRKSAVKRVWDTAGDNRVRHSHNAMDGQIRGLDEPFKTPSGALLMYPGDTSLGAGGKEVIQCRCKVHLKADFLSGWND